MEVPSRENVTSSEDFNRHYFSSSDDALPQPPNNVLDDSQIRFQQQRTGCLPYALLTANAIASPHICFFCRLLHKVTVSHALDLCASILFTFYHHRCDCPPMERSIRSQWVKRINPFFLISRSGTTDIDVCRNPMLPRLFGR